MPWIAREAGLFKNTIPDFNLVFIPRPPSPPPRLISGDAEIGVTGAVGNVRAIVQGTNDLVFIGGMKNFLTHSIMGKADIKSPAGPQREESRRRALRRQHPLFCHPGAASRFGMDASKRYPNDSKPAAGQRPWRRSSAATSMPAGLVAPGDFQVASRGYRYVSSTAST